MIKFYMTNGHIWRGSLEDVSKTMSINAFDKALIMNTVKTIAHSGLNVDEVHFRNGSRIEMSQECLKSVDLLSEVI